MRAPFAATPSPVADVLVPAAIALVGVQEVWLPIPGASFSTGPSWLLTAVYLGVATALVWRRRAPLPVTVAVIGLLSIASVAFGSSDGLAPLLPILAVSYAIGRHGSAAEFWPGVGVVVLGIAIHELRDPRPILTGPTPVAWAVLVGAAFLGRLLADRARAAGEATERAAQAEAERVQAAARAAADERSRMTRELHDLVGHGLSVLVVQSGAAQATLDAGDTEGARRRLGQMETTARATMAELRTLLAVEDAGGPDDRLAPQPGIADIGTLVERVRDAGLVVEYTAPRSADEVPAGVALAAYRVVQEALTNVVKHAGSGVRARVEVAVNRDSVTVDVRDAGPSVSPDAGPGVVPGRGLAGMRERVALHGGTFSAGGQPGGGFAVRATLPLPGARP